MKRDMTPYEGNESYIFVSYCHKDRDFVFPIIEELQKNGCRIWFDRGINPGNDWPDVIAEHLKIVKYSYRFYRNNPSRRIIAGGNGTMRLRRISRRFRIY